MAMASRSFTFTSPITLSLKSLLFMSASICGRRIAYSDSRKTGATSLGISLTLSPSLIQPLSPSTTIVAILTMPPTLASASMRNCLTPCQETSREMAMSWPPSWNMILPLQVPAFSLATLSIPPAALMALATRASAASSVCPASPADINDTDRPAISQPHTTLMRHLFSTTKRREASDWEAPTRIIPGGWGNAIAKAARHILLDNAPPSKLLTIPCAAARGYNLREVFALPFGTTFMPKHASSTKRTKRAAALRRGRTAPPPGEGALNDGIRGDGAEAKFWHVAQRLSAVTGQGFFGA